MASILLPHSSSHTSQRSSFLTPHSHHLHREPTDNMSWNPFSRRRTSRGYNSNNDEPATSTNSSNLLGRAFSGTRKDSTRQVQQAADLRAARSPMQNPSPATRRPRAQSPPPAYTANATPASGSSSLGASPCYEPSQTGAHPALSVAQASTDDDPYAFLSSFDTVFLIDDSGSMTGRSWRETQQAMSTMLPTIFAHDEDGPDLYFMNHKSSDVGSSQEPWKAGTGYRNITRSHGSSSQGEQLTVEEMFKMVRPQRATPTGQRLNLILRQYLKRYEEIIKQTGDETCLKPLSIIVITDGAPSDEVGAVIVQAAKKLDKLDAPPYQVGIQFFQVGNEPGAAAALRELDDDLKISTTGDVRDIVDTVSFDADSNGNTPVLTGDGILKAVLGSVVKRLDSVNANLRTTRRRS